MKNPNTENAQNHPDVLPIHRLHFFSVYRYSCCSKEVSGISHFGQRSFIQEPREGCWRVGGGGGGGGGEGGCLLVSLVPMCEQEKILCVCCFVVVFLFCFFVFLRSCHHSGQENVFTRLLKTL